MSKKQKPVKIKRHKNYMSQGSNVSFTVKRFLPMIVGVLLIVGIGFLLGKPVLNFLQNVNSDKDTSSDTGNSSSQIESSSQIDSETSSEISSETSSQPVVVVPENKVEGRKYFYVRTAELSSPEKIDAVIEKMISKGATHCVFDLKNEDGTILYDTQNRYGKELADNVKVDVKLIAEKFGAKGLTPVARIYTFKDKRISDIERSTAVMYLGTDTRWLDSSAALGGKAWANPASPVMQQYIIDLTDEIMSLGIKNIIYAGFSTPTGYSLDKRDFGANMDQVLANMKNLLNTLKGKVSAKGGQATWQFEYSAVQPEGSYAEYIVHPYQLGADDVIITANGKDIEEETVVPALENQADKREINITLWLTDNIDVEKTHTMDSYFMN